MSCHIISHYIKPDHIISYLNVFGIWLNFFNTILVDLCLSILSTLSETNIAAQNWWLGDYLSFWEGPFSGPMLVVGRVLVEEIALSCTAAAVFPRCSLCFGNVADSVSVAESLQVIKLSDSLAHMKASTAV